MTVTSTLRFPSGVTIAQAKKDAKSLAKTDSVSLSKAQDAVAQRNGLDMPWGKAMSWLNRQAPRPLASFGLTLRQGGNHVIDIPEHAPFIPVIGPTGCGKSVLALELARQQLAALPEARLYWCSLLSGPNQDEPEFSPDRYMAEHQLSALETCYSDRVLCLPPAAIETLPGADIPNGSVFIVDSVEHVANPNRLFHWAEAVRKNGHMLIATGDETSYRYAPPYFGIAFIGRTNRYDQLPTVPVHDINKLVSTLDGHDAECREFVAASENGRWIGVVRVPSPLA